MQAEILAGQQQPPALGTAAVEVLAEAQQLGRAAAVVRTAGKIWLVAIWLRLFRRAAYGQGRRAGDRPGKHEETGKLGPSGGPGLRALGVFVAVVLAAELVIALLGTSLKGVETEGAQWDPSFGTPNELGELLLTRFLFPFEAVSMVLRASGRCLCLR